ncbi:uncharacterized protein LOC121927021 isoform X1 [Sceloporus undulatus]|uniref:uncharacterized protein LOC121927021 isoform X1 n=1 Tax=Sceloporus undulatus TaxID=8520 RepID=UPI001C4B05A9|nr:uncharacterized protein LOC121927021 isoform X1 [Sceloporus undulatus]
MELVAEQQQQQQKREQRRRPAEYCLHEPERVSKGEGESTCIRIYLYLWNNLLCLTIQKRVCRSLEMICTSHPPSKCAVDFNAMEQDSSQDDPTEFLNPQIMKEKLNCTIFPHNETRAPVQPCPRCIAGEPTAFVHEEMRMYSQTNLDLREKAEGIWIFNNIRQ